MKRGGWLLGALALTLVGCLPYPHRYQHVPHVEGQVTDAGAAAAGVHVTLRFMGPRQSPCTAPAEDAAVTDADGRFTLTGERRVRLYIVVLPVHSSESWGFCFTRPDGSHTEWSSPRWYRAGPRYGPMRMTIECDLARRPADICWVLAREYGKSG